MIGRRTLFGAGTSLAVGSMLDGLGGSAKADELPTYAPVSGEVDPRGAQGRLVRLGTLDLESQQDFNGGFRMMHSRKIRAATQSIFERLLAKKGIDPTSPVTIQEMLALVEHDPQLNLVAKTWLANQQIGWKTLVDYFHANADMYLSELAAADDSGPGSLTLQPKLDVPTFARHEIHIQPGGYVGDEFAGYIYHNSTNAFYLGVIGHNEQDQIHRMMAANLPMPGDGKVKRILDMGCGPGQLTAALKQRFPDAEVWGVDIGAPMVRYAHMRARRLELDVHFVQGLAEDTGFPDKHFDLVVSYLLHHEIPGEITRKVVAEAHRVTRPGGVYYPIDFISAGTKGPAQRMYQLWWDHRWNNEVWSLEFHAVDFAKEIKNHGFTMPANAKPALPGFGVRHSIRV